MRLLTILVIIASGNSGDITNSLLKTTIKKQTNGY